MCLTPRLGSTNVFDPILRGKGEDSREVTEDVAVVEGGGEVLQGLQIVCLVHLTHQHLQLGLLKHTTSHDRNSTHHMTES